MRYFLYIIFGLIFSTNSSKYISGEVIYTVSLNNSIKENRSSKIKELLNNAKDVNYKLVFNTEESKYQKIKSMSNDLDASINLTEVAAGGENIFYFNSSTGENLYSNKGYEELFLITQKSLNWKLTKEKKQIDNYICYKAVALNGKLEKSDIIAWYTLDIPLSFGPKYYNGLPGLILELNTKKIRFKATKIKLSEKQKEIEKPLNGIKITYEEYKKRLEGVFNED